ncbi:D-ribose transporter ATP-binding protein [Planctomycetaceae bacterium SCGC AG-212-F19]|nr:D-ribose transporter ATP-binding protein [Planctomycetaceae bacterium SCGC AG-212-F19]
MTSPPPLLEAHGVSKRFPGVQALDGVSLSIQAGEVLALIGENGAGKSTLMKILAGIHTPDAGELRLDARPLRLGGVADALARGIVLIHQELNLADNLSVADNIFLGRERTRLGWLGWLGWLDRPAMAAASRELLARVGLDVAPHARVGDLPLGQQQMVEIARALSRAARVIIMDEPTSSLTQRETDRLFEVIADLKSAGVAVVYISHRLGEVQRIADRVVVLRDGRNSGDLTRAEITHAAMVQLMVGRDLQQFFHRTHPPAGEDRPIRLDVRNVSYAGGPSAPVSFQVRAGEIVGMAGLVGAGRTELAEALFGIRRVTTGEVRLDGRPAVIHHPRQAIAVGLLLAPEDRRLYGLILADNVQHNISLASLDRVSFLRLVVPARETHLATTMCGRLRVKTPRLAQPVGLLSGGNQQKVVLGKWLAREPRILILDEPTRGVDVGAKSEIYALMDELANSGVAILMISSDLEEVLGMSDRVLVLHEGRLAGELTRDQLSEQAIMHLATGGAGPAA